MVRVQLYNMYKRKMLQQVISFFEHFCKVIFMFSSGEDPNDCLWYTVHMLLDPLELCERRLLSLILDDTLSQMWYGTFITQQAKKVAVVYA